MASFDSDLDEPLLTGGATRVAPKGKKKVSSWRSGASSLTRHATAPPARQPPPKPALATLGLVAEDRLRRSESAKSEGGSGGVVGNARTYKGRTLVRYRVQKSDTLQGLSLKFSVTTDVIRKLNFLANDRLVSNVELWVPADLNDVPKGPEFGEGEADLLGLTEEDASKKDEKGEEEPSTPSSTQARVPPYEADDDDPNGGKLKQSSVQLFHLLTKHDRLTTEDAGFYLQDSDGDIGAALRQASSDAEWERTAAVARRRGRNEI